MLIKRLSMHAIERLATAKKEYAPSKVIRNLDALRNQGFQKPTKTGGIYIVASHGVFVVVDEVVVTYIGLNRLNTECGEALRAYTTFYKIKEAA